MEINKYIDHTLLKPDASLSEIDTLCNEAAKYDFASVCVNPFYVHYCHQKLEITKVKVCTVIGFPLGANTRKVKAYETKNAISNGADEIDMVLNIGALKSKKYDLVLADMKAVRKAAKRKVVKLILETCLLTEEEIKTACEMALDAKLDFVKTSTGFSKGGATVNDIKLMKSVVGDKMGIKASGGVRDYATAMAMIEAGATRIGASSGVAIVEESKNPQPKTETAKPVATKKPTTKKTTTSTKKDDTNSQY